MKNNSALKIFSLVSLLVLTGCFQSRDRNNAPLAPFSLEKLESLSEEICGPGKVLQEHSLPPGKDMTYFTYIPDAIGFYNACQQEVFGV